MKSSKAPGQQDAGQEVMGNGIVDDVADPQALHDKIISVLMTASKPLSESDIVQAVLGNLKGAEPIAIQFRIARMCREGELLRYHEPKAAKPLYLRATQ